VTVVVAYRHAAYDSPWWVIPSTREGRFNRAYQEDPTQYLALHPLGPTAELLRHQLRGPDFDRVDTILANLWAVRVDAEGSIDITFDNCASDYGITPEDLVGDEYAPTQALASRLRDAGLQGFTVPSAALPGADNLILFGPRVAHPYLELPVTPEECPTGHLSDAARPAQEVLPLVRFRGAPHTALDAWLATGTYKRLDDPVAIRW
jgi:RES domain-containing protein